MNTRPATIVTGGSRGIGAATVTALAAGGHDVVLSYRQDEAAAEQVVAQATAAGARCVAVQADVTREDDVDRLFEAAAQLGPVTGLVANAGLTAHIGDLTDTPVQAIRRVIDFNLVGAVLCSRRPARSHPDRRRADPAGAGRSARRDHAGDPLAAQPRCGLHHRRRDPRRRRAVARTHPPSPARTPRPRAR